MKNKLTICIDMDDTIENLMDAWIKEINLKYNLNYVLDDIKEWDIEKCIKEVDINSIFSILREENFWDKVLPKKDAIEYLEKLNNIEDINIYIATNTHYEIIANKMNKVLFKYFPYLCYRQLIFIRNKQLLNCDILIDDAYHNLENGTYDKILIDMPYNQNVESIDIKDAVVNDMIDRNIVKRADNWKDIYEYILHKLQLKKEEI